MATRLEGRFKVRTGNSPLSRSVTVKKKSKTPSPAKAKTPSPAKAKTPSPAKAKTPSPAKVKTPSPAKVIPEPPPISPLNKKHLYHPYTSTTPLLINDGKGPSQLTVLKKNRLGEVSVSGWYTGDSLKNLSPTKFKEIMKENKRLVGKYNQNIERLQERNEEYKLNYGGNKSRKHKRGKKPRRKTYRR
jgi:hypothetical protein